MIWNTENLHGTDFKNFCALRKKVPGPIFAPRTRVRMYELNVFDSQIYQTISKSNSKYISNHISSTATENLAHILLYPQFSFLARGATFFRISNFSAHQHVTSSKNISNYFLFLTSCVETMNCRKRKLFATLSKLSKLRVICSQIQWKTKSSAVYVGEVEIDWKSQWKLGLSWCPRVLVTSTSRSLALMFLAKTL